MLKDVLNGIEADIQRYLEENPGILISAFGNPRYYYTIVIPQFEFGNEYRSDFIVVYGQSYKFFVALVELERANIPMFTKKGDPSYQLTHAIKQVDDWERWINNDKSNFCRTLLRAIKKRYPDFDENINPDRIGVSKKVVIGRRASLSEENNSWRSQKADRNLDIVPYDRLVEFEEDIVNKGTKFIKHDDTIECT